MPSMVPSMRLTMRSRRAPALPYAQPWVFPHGTFAGERLWSIDSPHADDRRMDPDLPRLFRQEAFRQRLLSLMLSHAGPVGEFEALSRDLDAAADRLERAALYRSKEAEP
jgi:hypothetical protein